jgi:hypothetical protein
MSRFMEITGRRSTARSARSYGARPSLELARRAAAAFVGGLAAGWHSKTFRQLPGESSPNRESSEPMPCPSCGAMLRVVCDRDYEPGEADVIGPLDLLS